MKTLLRSACLYVLCGMGLPGLALAQPANDSFASPAIVEGFPATVAGSNEGATLAQDEPVPSSSVEASVWFVWEAPLSGGVRIDTFGSDFDTWLAVWSGAGLDSLTLLAENDDFASLQSAVFLNVTGGATYRIAVYGYSSSRGDIILNIAEDLTAKITGTVTGPDGTTFLQGIDVDAYQWNGFQSDWQWMGWARTDATGNYTIGGLAAGTYRVRFSDWQNGDHLSEVYDNAADLDSGTDIVVPAETTVTGIDASLATASKITGTVTGPDGTTFLQGIDVDAYQWNGTESYWQWMGWARTDATGNYAIGGLAAGTYRVRFADWQNGDHFSEVYDNATDLDSGTDIVVPAVTTVSGIDASLATASKITGTVTGPDGSTPLQGIGADAFQWNAGESYWQWMGWAQTDAEGNYAIGGLAAGTYRVEFGDWYNGDYLSEVYDNAPDLDSGTDIVVPAATTVTGIDASLAGSAAPEPPRIVALERMGGNDWEVRFVGTPGVEYILQEVQSLTGAWQDVGTPFLCHDGINVRSRQSSAPGVFWRIREYP